jgi:hypothetical protein
VYKTVERKAKGKVELILIIGRGVFCKVAMYHEFTNAKLLLLGEIKG